MPSEPVLTLYHSSDAGTVGGKAAGLARVKSVGLNVPDGFVVVAACCRWEPGIRPPRLGQALRSQIADAYSALGSGNGFSARAPLVAVRSSAVGEDSPDRSYAGQFLTKLAVRGTDELSDAIRDCWLSLWRFRMTHRQDLRSDSSHPRSMAVIVQRQLSARSSGVAFSLDPRNGDRARIAIESSWGLGIGAVGGEAADLFVVDKHSGAEVERRVISKPYAWRCSPRGQGLTHCTIPEHMRCLPSISDGEIAEICAAVLLTVSELGHQTDVEWAVDSSGKLHILQARPETAWSRRESTNAISIAGLTDRIASTMSRRRPIG